MEKIKTVLFEQEAVALGRNGTIKQFGVEAWFNSDTKAVRLTPTDKNGEPRTGWLDLEAAKLPQVLAAICEVSAEKDPAQAIAVAIHAATIVALEAIKTHIGPGMEVVLDDENVRFECPDTNIMDLVSAVRNSEIVDEYGDTHSFNDLRDIDILTLAHIVCRKLTTAIND